MTSFNSFPDRNRDTQDLAERHVFGKLEYVDGAGAVVKVRGTGTEDQEAPVINSGYGFNLKTNSDAEVILLSLGSDTNQKFAFLNIPHKTQRKWKEGTGGVQHPNDPDHALEFNDKRAHITKDAFAVGNGIIEVKDGKVYIRADVFIDGTTTTSKNVVAPDFTNGSATVPGFEA